jgi:hypothetical protein
VSYELVIHGGTVVDGSGLPGGFTLACSGAITAG